MQKEWYLLEYERKPNLHKKIFSYLEFPSRPNHHEHCELCWSRFSQYPKDQHIGYFDPEEKIWICEDCYTRFKYLFGWEVIGNH